MHANTKHLHGNVHDTKVIMKKPSYFMKCNYVKCPV